MKEEGLWQKGPAGKRAGLDSLTVWGHGPDSPGKRETTAAFYLQLLKDFLLGLELFVWLALLIALHKHSLTRSRACRRVQRLNLAADPSSGKTHRTRKE